MSIRIPKNEVFSLLESWSAGDIKKEELVRVGLGRDEGVRHLLGGSAARHAAPLAKTRDGAHLGENDGWHTRLGAEGQSLPLSNTRASRCQRKSTALEKN